MTLRRSLLAVASVALAVVLIALLIKVGRINLRVTLEQLRSVSLISFTKLALLNVLLVYPHSRRCYPQGRALGGNYPGDGADQRPHQSGRAP